MFFLYISHHLFFSKWLNIMKHNKIRIIAITISLSLFLFSLTQNTVTISALKTETISSLDYFFTGITAILDGDFMDWLVWLANPLCVISMILLIKKNKTAKTTSSIALLLALSFSAWRTIRNENGSTSVIISLELGYYLWILSILSLTIGTFYYFKTKKKYKKERLSSPTQLP